MSDDLVTVSTYRNVPISYDPEKKQFVARVGGRDVRKPTQHAVEKMILKYQGGGETMKVMYIHDGYWNSEAKEVEAIGVRGSKILYRRPGRDEVDSLDGDDTYVFDQKLFDQAKELFKEREEWKRRLKVVLDKMKRVDPEELR